MLQHTSPILFDDAPITLPRVLVSIFGWEQAHFIQQAHWWLTVVARGGGGKIDENERPWFYKSIAQWEDELFPLIKRSTINNYRRNLIKKGILIQVEEINKAYWGGSRTWYSLNYDKLNELYAVYLKNQPISPKQRRKIKAQGGMSRAGIPQGETGMSRAGIGGMPRAGIHTKSTYTERTESKENAADLPQAAQSALPAALDAGSSIKNAPSRTGRANQKKIKSPARQGERVLYEDLTPLGKCVVDICGRDTSMAVSPNLTGAQADALAAEYEVPFKGEVFNVTPDDLFKSDPLYKQWIETEVYAFLRVRGGDLPIARGKAVRAVTMQNAAMNLTEFYGWRETVIEKEKLEYALAHAEMGEDLEINLLTQWDDDDDLDDDLEDLDE